MSSAVMDEIPERTDTMPETRTAIVVDDEPITRLDLRQMLGEMGFLVMGDAADGFDAIALCRQYCPDVVLMDIKMPVFDGLAASETIISEQLAGCVVLLTAFRDPELIEQANRVGVTGYLVKPVEERLLLPTLEVALAQARRLRLARQETAEVRARLEEQKVVDHAKALLARQEGLSESDAYRRLQQMAMDKRCTLAAIARVLVAQSGGKEQLNRAKTHLMRQRGVTETEARQVIAQLAREKGVEEAVAARELLEQAR